jgi:hypothetical protein
MPKESLPVSIKKWRAAIRVGANYQHLGMFSCERVAALAYDGAARKAFGAFARPNFGEVT